MDQESPAATPGDLRRFAVVHLAIALVFLLVIGWIVGGTDASRPPAWLLVVLFLVVAIGVFLAERVWLRGPAVDPAASPSAQRQLALEAFGRQTVLRLAFTEIPLLVAVVASFVFDHGAWPIIIIGPVGLIAQAWETWPSLRTVSMATVIFDSAGAETGLIDAFLAD